MGGNELFSCSENCECHCGYVKSQSSLEYKYNHMSSSFFHYKRWVFGLTESKKINNLKELNQILDKINPDTIIIHGDRFDIIPIALCSSLMNICLIHIEGGELTGTIDEHLRHSISKLATYHFVCNSKAIKIFDYMIIKNLLKEYW